MFASWGRGARLLFEPGCRGIVVRALLLTLLLFLVELVLCEWAVALLPGLGNPAINKALALLAPVFTLFLLSLLGAPVTALWGSIFLDRIADRIERRDYPGDPPARPGSFAAALKAGLRLTVMVMAADILLLPLDVALPGVGEALSLGVNGWLLGWEYFELAALRHLSVATADRLRRVHRREVWMGGTLIAVLAAVPVLNLLAPLFGTAQMVHLFKHLHQGDGPA